MNLLLVLLLLQDRPIEESVEAFLKGDMDARAELVKLGAYAIRPLRSARDKRPERIEEFIYEIKKRIAGPNGRQAVANLDFTKTLVTVGDFKVESTLQSTVEYLAGTTFVDYIDPKLLKSRTYKVEHSTVAARVILDDLCRQTGLDYGIFHGMLVVGHPERLWPIRRPPTVPPLDDAGLKRAKELVEKLGDESIEIRDAATRDLLAMGTPLIAYLETQSKRAEAEIAARCEAIIRRLRVAIGGEFRPPAISRQKLNENEQALSAKLQNSRHNLLFKESSFEAVMTVLTRLHGIPFEVRCAPDLRPVNLRTDGQSYFDVLALVTQSLGLDFVFKDRKLIIDTREAIEKLISESK